jgi:hypothetical protein
LNRADLARLRRLAREMLLPPAALETALACGLFDPGQAATEQHHMLRQMRRLIDDLGVNAPAAALLVRMRRDLEILQRELERLRALEAEFFDNWAEGLWRELED